MQTEDDFRRHLASYRIDGFPLDDRHHLTRARSTPRITVPNAAYGLGVRSPAIAVERPLLPALASSGNDCQPPPKAFVYGDKVHNESPFGSAPAVPDW